MKYKVNVLRVLGKNNKTYKVGDIVEDSNFPEGNASILEKDGKLIRIGEKKEEKKEPEKLEKKEKVEEIKKEPEKLNKK